LKPGLVSKSFDVAEWAARLFSKLAFEFGDNNLLSYSWEWFVGESGGLNTTLLSLKRHPDLLSLVIIYNNNNNNIRLLALYCNLDNLILLNFSQFSLEKI
jgi:hypothetical protein